MLQNGQLLLAGDYERCLKPSGGRQFKFAAKRGSVVHSLLGVDRWFSFAPFGRQRVEWGVVVSIP